MLVIFAQLHDAFLLVCSVIILTCCCRLLCDPAGVLPVLVEFLLSGGLTSSVGVVLWPENLACS